MKRHRFFTMYLTTTVSITLLLLLIGLESVFTLGAHHLIREVKENFTLTVVMTSETDSLMVQRLKTIIESAPYTQSYRYISKEEALQDHIQALGEDPTRFLGYNPLTDAYEVSVRSMYAQADSMAVIQKQLQTLSYVDKVLYQEDIVRVLDRRLSSVSIILSGAALLLLLVAWVLIVNTIRMQVYAKRFLIHTMRLVGATPHVIRAPFIRRAVLMGVEAGVVSCLLLVGMLYYIRMQMGLVFFPLTWQNLLIVSGVVLLSGILLTSFAALFATGKYVRMTSERMYEI